jgi:hypothetical protein
MQRLALTQSAIALRSPDRIRIRRTLRPGTGSPFLEKVSRTKVAVVAPEKSNLECRK